MRRGFAVLSLALALFGLGACGDGEDRPGTVTEEGGTGTGTGSASGTGTGSVSGTGTGAAPAFGQSEADATLEVTLQDFAFVGLPADVSGPKVFFRATNQGPAEHELEVLDSAGEPLGEIGAMPSGAKGELAVELAPGVYTAQCLVEERGRTHAELGMKTTFRVG